MKAIQPYQRPNSQGINPSREYCIVVEDAVKSYVAESRGEVHDLIACLGREGRDLYHKNKKLTIMKPAVLVAT